MSSQPAPEILIAARRVPSYHGGLAQYQRCLATELQARHKLNPVFCALESGGLEGQRLPCEAVVIEDICREPRRFWMSMASRKFFHPALERWIDAVYSPALAPLEKRSVSVVHFVGTGWDFMGFAVGRWARRTGARFTIWPAVHPGQWGDDRIDLRLYREADAIFCQSPHEAHHLIRLGLDPSRTVICSLPPMCLADGNGERLRKRLGIGERPAVFFLGHRISAKGYPALLQAWKTVRDALPEAVLLLGGPGGERDAALVQELPADSLRDLGVVGERDKADAYAACNVFCLPSAHESFGIVFAEAWSYGKPVICGPAPSSREWIENHLTGLHVDQDPRKIAGAILELLADPHRAAAMGAAGRNFQQTHLTWDKTLASHMAAFQL